MEGCFRILGSSCTTGVSSASPVPVFSSACRSASVSGTSFPERSTSLSPKGNSSTVMMHLKPVWNMEISTGVILCWARDGSTMKTTVPITPKSTAPITLKERWMEAALRAVRLPPRADSSAVTQDPMFSPRVMKMAALVVTRPFTARVCRIPTETEELCSRAVIRAPERMPRMGFFPSSVKTCPKMGASV